MGKSYDFKTVTKQNNLLFKSLIRTSQHVDDESYDMNFIHQFMDAEKCDAKML